MQTILVRLRIVLTLIVLGFPLRSAAKRLRGVFQQASIYLQKQVNSAKERIQTTPSGTSEQIDGREQDTTYESYDEEDDNEDPILPDEETPKKVISDGSEELWGAPDSTEKIKEDDISSILSTPSSPQAQQELEGDVPEKGSAHEDTPQPTDTELDLSPEKVSTSESTPDQSPLSAEKLSQTIDDIKYAALTYKERGKKAEYEKKLIEGISLIGDHEEFLVMLADHYFASGMYVKAATLLKKIISLHPQNHRAIRQLGQIYMIENNKETAKLLLEKARDLKDDNPKYLISLVEIYYEEKNLKECISIVEKLSKIRPTNIDYLLTLGQLYQELNQPTKAHTYYMKVLELNPLNDEAKQAIKKLL